MLTGVQVYNTFGNLVLTLPVASSLSSSYIVKGIDGLGPVKADITAMSYANQDGGEVQTSRSGSRNIIMSIGYKPDYHLNQSVQTLRRDLYSYFPPKGVVRLRLLDDENPPLEIKGVIESQDPVIFSQDPEVQISILCTSPYFTATSKTIIDSYEGNPVPVGAMTAETGFVVEVFANRPIHTVTIKNGLNPDIVYSGSLVYGDLLSISTVRGDKYVRTKRGTVTTSDLDGLTKGSLSMIIGSRTGDLDVVIGGRQITELIQITTYRVIYTPTFVGF